MTSSMTTAGVHIAVGDNRARRSCPPVLLGCTPSSPCDPGAGLPEGAVTSKGSTAYGRQAGVVSRGKESSRVDTRRQGSKVVGHQATALAKDVLTS